MADRNIDESVRKPRRTKGTPFFRQRNYYAAAVIAFGGISWYIYELWPQTQKLRKKQLEGNLFETPPEVRTRFLEAELSRKPGYQQLITKLKQR